MEKTARDKDPSLAHSYVTKNCFNTAPGDYLSHMVVSFPPKDKLLALPVKKMVSQTEAHQLISLKRQIMSKKFL